MMAGWLVAMPVWHWLESEAKDAGCRNDLADAFCQC
jgi:hypothetical protein